MKFNHWKVFQAALLFLMICCYQNKQAIMICFLQEDVTKKLMYLTYLKVIFTCHKVQFRQLLSYFFLFKETPGDNELLFHVKVGLDMDLKDWKQFCRMAWENDFEFLQIDRLAKKVGGDTLSEIVIKLLI